MANASTDTTVAVRSLDLSARVLDLTAVLTQSSSAVNGLIEIGQWLALERVNKAQLYGCFEKVRGLIIANENGQKFYNDVLNAKPSKTVWPLVVVQSGALGRIMVKDSYLAWTISTTACLMRYHDEKFVSGTVCMLIMQSDPEHEGRPDYELRYLASRIELKSVVDRIISSIWFNVVNSHANKIELPEELQAVCQFGHHLSGEKLGLVIHSLKRFKAKVVFEARHLIRNLTHWLLLHLPGILIVSVSGKIVFEKRSGESPRSIELKVAQFCPEDQPCEGQEDNYRLFSEIKGSFTEFLRGSHPSRSDLPPTSKTRKSLYDIPNTYDIGASVLPAVIKQQARQTSQLMTTWLLGLQVIPPLDFSDFGLSVQDLDQPLDRSPSSLTIGNILRRSPSLLNRQEGRALVEQLVYAPADFETESPTDSDDRRAMESRSRQDRQASSLVFQDEDILAYFPVLRDLVLKAKADCNCSECGMRRDSQSQVSQTDLLGYRIPAGCMSQAAISWVLISVSQAISDGFGAPDVSGNRETEHILKGITTLFAELLQQKQIRWDTWFNLAACVYLGCPFKE